MIVEGLLNASYTIVNRLLNDCRAIVKRISKDF